MAACNEVCKVLQQRQSGLYQVLYMRKSWKKGFVTKQVQTRIRGLRSENCELWLFTYFNVPTCCFFEGYFRTLALKNGYFSYV